MAVKTLSDITPSGLTTAEVHGLVAKVLNVDVDHIEDVAIVARVNVGDKRGFAFAGIGEPVDQGKFLAEALDNLTDGIIDQIVDGLAKAIGIELPGDDGTWDKESYTGSPDHESYTTD